MCLTGGAGGYTSRSFLTSTGRDTTVDSHSASITCLSTHSTSSSVFILLSFAQILRTNIPKSDSYNQSGGIYYKVTAASSALCVSPLI